MPCGTERRLRILSLVTGKSSRPHNVGVSRVMSPPVACKYMSFAIQHCAKYMYTNTGIQQLYVPCSYDVTTVVRLYDIREYHEYSYYRC